MVGEPHDGPRSLRKRDHLQRVEDLPYSVDIHCVTHLADQEPYEVLLAIRSLSSKYTP